MTDYKPVIGHTPVTDHGLVSLRPYYYPMTEISTDGRNVEHISNTW